ncbi:MAG: hypothetical protein AB7N80_01090 [Bdellovibrionales bacterium]
MKKMILITFVAIIVCVIGFLVSLSFAVESARESIESDKPCEGHKTLKWASPFSKEAKYLLGSLHSRGVCVAQDVSRAKDLYASVYGGDSRRVAQALFHDAIQLADFYERTQKDQKPENVRALLVESKSLGFQPSDRESKDLADRGLTEAFAESAPKQ